MCSPTTGMEKEVDIMVFNFPIREKGFMRYVRVTIQLRKHKRSSSTILSIIRN